MRVVTIFILCLLLKCATLSQQIGERIIGGTPASAGQFPFMAAIHKITSTGNYFCSGTLITKLHVLTAAQCVYNATSFQVRLGSHYLQTSDDNRVIVSTPIYYYHDQYDPYTLEYDAGVIEFLLPITQSTYLRPIHNIGGPTPPSYSYTTVGWGQTSDSDGSLSDGLNYVTVVVISNDECKMTYGNQIGEYTICTSGNYNEGTCTGDTGSPLIWYTVVPRMDLLVGVSSFVSSAGCENVHPSGFLRIDYIQPWLDQFL